jgi:peptidoglycan/xylan/chitin deacetylase (PgdA/CDA1 family)
MNLFKRISLSVLCFILLSAGAFAFWLSQKHTVPIIMYHRVNYTEKPQQSITSPENFRWQMEYIKKHGYQVIRLADLVQAQKTGKRLPKKSVVISFDDGTEDNYTYAFPILKEYGFPAIIFIPFKHVDLNDFLKTAQIKEMLAAGIDFGSHAYHHAYLPDLPLDQQKLEIFESKHALEKTFGIPIDYFAYPVGGFMPQTKQMVIEAGYKAACTTNRGEDKGNQDLYELKRIRFSDKDNKNYILWMKLTGYYNLFRKKTNAY